MAKSRLQIIPLGGLGEVGKNMTVFRYGDEIIVIDAGMAFPDETMPGVDIVIPDFSYLIENRDKIKAILITHGHEDHIGSLAYLLRDVSAPVYATRLTCGLIEGKLKEQKIGKYNLNVVKTGDEFRRGSFRFGFFHVCHSIPDSCGVYVRTPVGTVVHTGDFKFDLSPVGDVADYVGFSKSYFSAYFKETLGFSVSAFILRCKLEEGRELLQYTDKSISTISEFLCFSSQSHFHTAFKKQFGMTPSEYRKRACNA